MIRNSEVFKIGFITKQRGLRGEVEMSFTDDCFDSGTSDYLVIEMDGILVPFFWEEYSFKTDDTAIIKFEDIDTDIKARTLVKHSVYYPKKHVTTPKNQKDCATLSSYKALTGFEVLNAKSEILGKIVHVDDSSANILLTINHEGSKELLVPFHNDFLIAFDLRERTIQIDIPEELLHLN